MFLNSLGVLFLVQSFCLSSLLAEDWIEQASKRIDENTIRWFKDLIHQEKLSKSNSKQLSKEEIEALAKKKCPVGEGIVDDSDDSLFIFLSFSAPEEIWLDLSKELQKVKGTIVIRGLPQNSFKEFYQRLKAFDQKGFSASLQIDPKLFEKFGVDKVPTFVVSQDGHYDKVSGNISLFAALELLSDKAHSAQASSLLLKYKQR